MDETKIRAELAEIEGFVDEKGEGYWMINNSKVDAITANPIELDTSKEGVYSYLNGVRFKAYYFIYSSGLIPKQADSYIREVTREKGGIRMYRNGFRVLPYGESNNDWLGLDASKG